MNSNIVQGLCHAKLDPTGRSVTLSSQIQVTEDT